MPASCTETVSTIDPRQRLSAVLRQEVAALRPAAKAGPRQAASAHARPSLAQLAAARVQAIAADDPRRKDKAVRIFLESAILREFGAGLAQDPGFGDLLDAVQAQFREDAQLAQAADRLAAFLLSV